MRINNFIIKYIEEKVKDKKNIEIIGLTKRESKNVIRLLEEQQKVLKSMVMLNIITYIVAFLFGIIMVIQAIK